MSNVKKSKRKVVIKPKAPSKRIKQYVKKEIHKNIENKFDSRTVNPVQIPAFIGDNNTAGNIFPIFPTIQQGVTSHNRTGNKITPKSMIIKGYITLDMTDNTADYDRICVRLVAGFAKRYPLAADMLSDIAGNPGNNWTNELIDYGDGGKVPFDGTLRALQSPINRECFTVKKQVFMKLSRPRFNNQLLSGSDTYRYSGNSTRFFTMKIACPKTIIYKDNDGQPNNFSPVLCAGYTLLNGANPGVPSALSFKPVTISFTTRLSYEDA